MIPGSEKIANLDSLFVEIVEVLIPICYERCYVYNIFTTNYRWLVVIGSNLKLIIKNNGYIYAKYRNKYLYNLAWQY